MITIKDFQRKSASLLRERERKREKGHGMCVCFSYLTEKLRACHKKIKSERIVLTTNKRGLKTSRVVFLSHTSSHSPALSLTGCVI
jgi:hypothetical protein